MLAVFFGGGNLYLMSTTWRGARPGADWAGAQGDTLILGLGDFDDLLEVELGTGDDRTTFEPRDRDPYPKLWRLFESLVRRYVPPEQQGVVWAVTLRFGRQVTPAELLSNPGIFDGVGVEYEVEEKGDYGYEY